MTANRYSLIVRDGVGAAEPPTLPVDDAHPLPVSPGGVQGSTGDLDADAAANTAASVTFAAIAGQAHVLDGIWWSYSGSGSPSGNLQIADGGNVIFNLDITALGPGFIPFPRGKKGTAGNAMTITLAAGGAGFTGKCGALDHWTAPF